MISRRRVMMAPLAVAGATLLGATVPRLTRAQDAATPTAEATATVDSVALAEGATIDVTGNGEASGEATVAILQFILRPNYNTVPTADAGSASPQPAVTQDQVDAVVAALKKGGVADDNIVSRIADAGYVMGNFGVGSAVVAAQLDEKLLAKAERIIERAGKAGTDAGATLDPVNVAYLLPDCSDVEHASLTDAVANAQAQAEQLAEVMGVMLGGVVKVSRQQSYGAYYGGAGGPVSQCQEAPKLADGLSAYFSVYNPDKSGEVEIYTTVQMTYAIA